MNKTIESKLKCFYLNTKLKPFLRLTRIKVEELYKRPQIVLIHDFLSDEEREAFLKMDKNRIERATVVFDNGTFSESRSRNSYDVHWPSTLNNIRHTIDRRIGAVVGLNARVSDNQLMMYNVGGYYLVHLDSDYHTIYRSATWINYLNDVPIGGRTVFPKLNITITPEKGSAVFWYNVLSSGVIDNKTAHSGCPVIVGNKWVVTKWIKNIGQVFTKPCSTNKKDYNVLQDI